MGKEWRPRLTKSELEYLVEGLKDRELALKELYGGLVRVIVLAATENNKWTGSREWSDALFHNFTIHGNKALLFFRASAHWKNRALDQEYRAYESVFDGINVEVVVTKSLRHRLEKLLNGKTKGRLDHISHVARTLLK